MKFADLKLTAIFARRHRGILLDIVVFITNVALMRMLMRSFIDIIKLAGEDYFPAQFLLFAGCVALFILPPVAAVLKRWHFHQRLQAEGKEKPPGEKTDKKNDQGFGLAGCLFNPIFYFCLTVVIFSAVNAIIIQFFYKNGDAGQAVTVTSLFIGLALMIIHTWLVYRYFSQPKHDPKSAFLRSPASETIADICIFTNMLLFQLIFVWITTVAMHFDRVASIGDFVGRLFFLGCVSMLIYFPPRILYLAEDIGRRRTWFFILLANSPVIFKVLIGTSPDGGW